MAQETEEREDSRLSTWVAFLIAAVSVVGAIVAWRAAVLGDAIGDADTGGLRATINLNETRALTTIRVYSAYSAFTEYYQVRQEGDLLEEVLEEHSEELDEAELTGLVADLTDTRDQMTAAQILFPNQYLNRDGTYALERMRGELFSDAAREKDLNPTALFLEGDTLRARSDRLLIALSILGVSLVFYTLVELVTDRLKMLLAVLGTLAFIVGGVAALLIETGRL
jgi:hypothetical protein